MLPQVFFALIIKQRRLLCCIPEVRQRRSLYFALVYVCCFPSTTHSGGHVEVEVLPQSFCDLVIVQRRCLCCVLWDKEAQSRLLRPHDQAEKSPTLLPRTSGPHG